MKRWKSHPCPPDFAGQRPVREAETSHLKRGMALRGRKRPKKAETEGHARTKTQVYLPFDRWLPVKASSVVQLLDGWRTREEERRKEESEQSELQIVNMNAYWT